MAGEGAQRLGGRFAKLWAATLASALGSGLATTAAPLFVAARTDDPVTVAATMAVAWLPWLLFALPGGVLVDSVDRRRLIIGIDWARTGVLVVLAVAMVTGWASIPLLFVVLFAVNTGEIVIRSASQAMVPSMVPDPLLERANGWLSGGSMLMSGMVAGPLAGLLFALAASGPFLANAVTYAASAVLMAMIAGSYQAPLRPSAPPPTGDVRPSAPPPTGDVRPGWRRGGWWRTVRADLVEGLRWLGRQRVLRTMAVLIALLNVTLTAATAVLVLLARERLGLGAVGYGLLFSCMAVGGVLGSALGDRLIRRVGATWTIRVGLLVEAGLHLTLATSRSAVVVGVAFLAFGGHGALWSIVANSLRQRLTPDELLGRVGSTILFVAAGGNCVGALLGGVVAATFGLTAPYWIGFVVAVVVTAATWRVFDRATMARAGARPTATVG